MLNCFSCIEYFAFTMKTRTSKLGDRGGLATIGLALVLGVLLTGTSVPVSSDVIIFPDPGLEAAIRDIINKPAGAIYDYDVSWLSGFGAVDRGIVSLEGIQFCPSITHVNLERNYIVDINLLSNLTNLYSLNLSDNQIVDISALAGLTNLWGLALGQNQIVDISPLSGLTNLIILWLDGNEIVDIGPIWELPSLKLLSLSELALEDLPRIASTWPTLGGLILSSCEAEIIGVVSELTNLERLGLEDCQIVDISPLAHLTNLFSLRLRDNQIVDISPLSGLTGLTELFLDSNQIVDIQALVDNRGLGTGDKVYLRHNFLDITPGSPDMIDIKILQNRGVEVVYEPQT